jgi:hypothetical protein
VHIPCVYFTGEAITRAVCLSARFIKLLEEIVHPLSGHILGDVVLLLNPADDLAPFPVDHIHVIVGKLPQFSLIAPSYCFQEPSSRSQFIAFSLLAYF